MELDEIVGRLPSFLARQRWFGSKSRTIASCHVDDVAGLDAGPRMALVVVRVSYADGTSERYGLLVAQVDDPAGAPAIAGLPGGTWIEAASYPPAVRLLLRGFANGAVTPTRKGGLLRYADSAAVFVALDDPATPVVPLSAEQSNTSIRVGERLMLKLFRRLEPGENPELEVGRFLTERTTFRAMSALRGSIAYVSPSGDASTVAVIQDWVENSGDGWRYVLGALDRAGREDTAGARLMDDMAQLGDTTARFHEALASDTHDQAFAPEPVTRHDIDRWIAAARELASDAFALVARQSRDWPDDDRELAARLLSQVSDSRHLIAVEHDATVPFDKIRVHGDYHLGQTLKTATGFVIIDFEGEPARPLAERRRKHCALKDVAGMLRSFDYAVETAGPPAANTAAPPLLSAMRRAFLERYVAIARSGDTPFLPADAGAIDRWLAFFEFEKALYELRYEINNRPTWVHIPLRAVCRALEGDISGAFRAG